MNDKQLVLDRLQGKQYYCECCGEEDLKYYIIDSLGSIFCDINCFMNSLEYRELSFKEVEIVVMKQK